MRSLETNGYERQNYTVQPLHLHCQYQQPTSRRRIVAQSSDLVRWPRRRARIDREGRLLDSSRFLRVSAAADPKTLYLRCRNRPVNTHLQAINISPETENSKAPFRGGHQPSALPRQLLNPMKTIIKVGNKQLSKSPSTPTTTVSNSPAIRHALTATVSASSRQGGKLNYRGIEVFNFAKKWHTVLPFLHEPRIEVLSHIGIEEFKLSMATERIELFIEQNIKEHAHEREFDFWLGTYNPKDGPWAITLSMPTIRRARKKMRAAVDAGKFETLSENASQEEKEEYRARYVKHEAQFYPQPDTLEWYQIWGSCHYIAPWLKALAQRVLPQWSWDVMRGENHSLVCGRDAVGRIKVLFDILNFHRMSARKLIEFAS